MATSPPRCYIPAPCRNPKAKPKSKPKPTANKYDISVKEMLVHNFLALLRWLLPNVASARVLKLPVELPATARLVDLIIQVKFKPQRPGKKPPPDKIYIFEFQVQRDPKLHHTMFLRASLAHILHGRRVKTIVLALTPQAVVPTDHIYGEGPDGDDLRHRVTVRRVFEESADAALASDIAALLPLIPAMKPGDGDHAALLSRVVERILKWALSDGQRAMMLEQAANFATLHLPRHKVDGIVKDVTRRHRIMLDPLRDFPLVRDGYRKGKAEGMAKGEAKGEAKGRIEGETKGRVEEGREALLRLDGRKLGQPREDLRARIGAIEDVEELNCLLERVLDVSTWDELLGSAAPPG